MDTTYRGKLAEPDPEARQKKDLLIPGGDFGWTWTIDLEIVERFNCDAEKKTGELGSLRAIAGDEKRTVAEIMVGLGDFDLPARGANAGAGLQYISGTIRVNLREEHTVNGSSEKTECFSEGTGRHEWVSPGSWNRRDETQAGQAYRDVEAGMVSLLIVKDMLGDDSSMENMQQQIAALQQKLQAAVQTMDL